MKQPPALSIKGITKSYHSHEALKALNLEVEEGGIFGLLGPNGAGKTTLIRMLTGITAPDTGQIEFFGESFRRDHIRSIGYLPEERGLYKSMRVGEQAMYFAMLRGLDRKDAEKRLRSWFERLEVGDWWSREVGDLSKGMAQKVQFIVSVMHDPRLLILDEPLSGFDPINAQRVREVITSLSREKGTTILLSTHNMESVEELCDQVALLNEGSLILKGDVESLQEGAREGRMTVGFRGTVMEFTVALGASAELIELLGDSNRDTHGPHEVLLRLPVETDIAQWIRWISEKVQLVSCAPWKPSMRDVFIQHVERLTTKDLKE